MSLIFPFLTRVCLVINLQRRCTEMQSRIIVVSSFEEAALIIAGILTLEEVVALLGGNLFFQEESRIFRPQRKGGR